MVLTRPQHPRYELYQTLNNRFFDTASPASEPDRGKFKANIWQMLLLAHTWTPGVMQQITADLYNICIITFSYKADHLREFEVSEVSVRGTYNSRHIFLGFVNDNHFQPMTTNQYKMWEFRYPRVTVEATAAFAHAPKETSTKTTTQHPWRNEFTREIPPPVPRGHGCDVNKLREFMGSKPLC
ncbi:uncharacterized protein BCR38DRAFT_432964 [Pseudomassariella vexata]|uniref:Uncharacterized protein n=1 Tax=Pseudomassariella vexata TaxID=1141098 RepID=A0A1Y2E2C7_9PEZI|nr:uncharacterized protein BCR38DRAFT_432964 [Pseudomassariella vexata]ORY65504.1 hypothetical protein BCR38DRAFT_432964 [Pseudomassariella vexata]